MLPYTRAANIPSALQIKLHHVHAIAGNGGSCRTSMITQVVQVLSLVRNAGSWNPFFALTNIRDNQHTVVCFLSCICIHVEPQYSAVFHTRHCMSCTLCMPSWALAICSPKLPLLHPSRCNYASPVGGLDFQHTLRALQLVHAFHFGVDYKKAAHTLHQGPAVQQYVTQCCKSCSCFMSCTVVMFSVPNCMRHMIPL